MARGDPTEDPLAREILVKIEMARQSRQKFQSRYNDFFDLAAPWRSRVGVKATVQNPQNPNEQDDIFDTTLQDVVDDWASDSADEYTPGYKPWTKWKLTQAADQFSSTGRQQIAELTESRQSLIYDRIRASNFQEQSQEFYVDLAIAPSAMYTPFTRAGLPLKNEHIPISELLILPGPFGGVDDRYWEREVQVRHLDVLFPGKDWSKYGRSKQMRRMSEATATIVRGCYRDWTKETETWTWVMLASGRLIDKSVFTGRGSCPITVGRTRVSSPSAYGIGSANKGVPASNALNELAFLNLRRESKIIDPAYLYYEGGTFNPEQGIEAGDWYAVSDDFKVQELGPQTDAREAYFTQDDLRMIIKRALYQDGPFQRADTPPSATQWLSEEERNARRKNFPRSRIIDEFVLNYLRRVEWILEKRGELDPIEIEGKLVNIEPVSPLSRASDLHEVQLADQTIKMFTSSFGPEAGQYVKIGATMSNVKAKLGADVLEIKTDEEVQQERAEIAAAADATQAGTQQDDIL